MAKTQQSSPFKNFKKKLFELLKGDKQIWIIYISLTIFSFLLIFSSTSMLAYKFQSGNTFYYLFRHTGFAIVGFALALFISQMSYKRLFNFSNLLLLISIGLLFFTFIFGTETNGAKRWMSIPFTSFTFQPSDIAKCTLVIYVAKIMAIHQADDEDIKKGFQISLFGILPICFLIFPSNLSTAIMVGLVATAMLIIAKVKIKHLLITFAIVAVAGCLVIGFLTLTGRHNRLSTWEKRIETYFNSNDTIITQSNHQSVQAKIAVGRGGTFGVGIGNSNQKNILPHPYSDFIYAIIIEEYGLAVGILVIILYLWLLYRCMIIAKNQTRTFPAYLAIGLSLNIIIQAFANMMVSVNLIPVTGQPLPFVSMGGTSTLITSASLGIIINISRYADSDKNTEKEVVEEEDKNDNIEDIADYPFLVG
ncbi:MAG: FtsW/RodA/SpoVE family cell cycle protein [Bacteroidales bacterium]|nr:FtsW/RodA/SpoVE family cell cycle protein [Bacteroidales bacterium]